MNIVEFGGKGKEELLLGEVNVLVINAVATDVRLLL